MPATTEHGFLAIADLTGYTAYLARGELEHAPTIAGDLIETVVGRLEPPFRLAKLEGDAAFLFVEDGRADGSLLLDSIEAAYVAFRRRLRSIEAASACACQACSLAPRLDLKLFLHHGSWVHGRIAQRDELAGPSVIVIHRLLKGTTTTAHDSEGRAMGFAIVTRAAVEALGLDPAQLGEGARMTREAVEPFGVLDLLQIDLEARWQAERERRRVQISADEATLEIRVELPVRPADAWAYLTAPAHRSAWEGSIVMLGEAGSPRGVGTTARCVSGRLATLEEIVDWQPYEHVGYRMVVPGVGPVEAAYDIEANGGRTVATLRWAVSPSVDVDPVEIARYARERRSALRRLADAIGRSRTKEGAT